MQGCGDRVHSRDIASGGRGGGIILAVQEKGVLTDHSKVPYTPFHHGFPLLLSALNAY